MRNRKKVARVPPCTQPETLHARGLGVNTTHRTTLLGQITRLIPSRVSQRGDEPLAAHRFTSGHRLVSNLTAFSLICHCESLSRRPTINIIIIISCVYIYFIVFPKNGPIPASQILLKTM